jgi:hypothetical protein
MFGRRIRGAASPAVRDTGFGIGVQVYVLDASEDAATPFPNGATGLVIRHGGSAWPGISAVGGLAPVWWIEFDSPQYTADLAGPYSKAQIPQRFLRLAPPATGADLPD